MVFFLFSRFSSPSRIFLRDLRALCCESLLPSSIFNFPFLCVLCDLCGWIHFQFSIFNFSASSAISAVKSFSGSAFRNPHSEFRILYFYFLPGYRLNADATDHWVSLHSETYYDPSPLRGEGRVRGISWGWRWAKVRIFLAMDTVFDLFVRQPSRRDALGGIGNPCS